jgi:hypothetical protein
MLFSVLPGGPAVDEREKKIQEELQRLRSGDSGYHVRMQQEDQVRDRTDAEGTRWRKVYIGGGDHFKNWLDQCIEIYGEENLEVEEIDASGFKCFEEEGEKLFRIWVREK